MTRFLLVRLLEGVAVLLGVVTVVFVIARMVGDPTALLLPPGTSAVDRQEYRHVLGLDRPIPEQYVDFIGKAVGGDFGTSFSQHRPAFEVILERLPATLQLASAALFIGLVFGSAAGIAGAWFRNSWMGFVIMLPAFIGQAVPVFWLGLVLIQVFGVSLEWLPTGGYGGFSSFILPAVTLGTFTAAAVARLLRSSLIEVLGEDYILTAWSKGLRPRIVLFRHALRNAATPALSMLGILAGELLGGSVVTETVFSWPGIGRAIVDAISLNDFPVAQAGVVVVATIFVLINIGVDILYGVLDPRVRIVQ
jgi:peptide/nickel transport system permease protein